MFFKKERREFLESIQKCAESIQQSNENLSGAINAYLAANDSKASKGGEITGAIETVGHKVTEVVSAMASAQEGEHREMMDAMIQSMNTIQGNNLQLAQVLEKVVAADSNSQIEESPTSDEDKWRVACALNLCAVSVSQIIEYNDLRFMEQEYENILNNLNLENMPKDATLLDTIKQIIDVIAFFRIQDGERQMLEQEYQHKIKNAIWDAVPSPSILISGAGAGVWGLVATLAMSVGTGYMNYRKAKANLSIENQRKMWELQKSALEQLHGLRRQLFETSWKLADDHEFDDFLRLSERQIRQFNEILTDGDPVRRYERLQFIESSFNAYPPFLYYIGSAALHAANEEHIGDKQKKLYLHEAGQYFEKYIENNNSKFKLLREDPIVAQCAFEYIAVLDLKITHGMLDRDESVEAVEKKKAQLIGTALESSGTALDTLQLCATAFVELGKRDEAVKLLNMLVNENYNTMANAQLLSTIYVSQMFDEKSLDGAAAEKYDGLLHKVKEDGLFPKPTSIQCIDRSSLDNAFVTNQKYHISKRFSEALKRYLESKQFDFNIIWNSENYIADDLIKYFNTISNDLSVLTPNVEEQIVLSLGQQLKGVEELSAFYKDRQIRLGYEQITFGSIMNVPIEWLITSYLSYLKRARNVKELSAVEKMLADFLIQCNISFEKHEVRASDIQQKLESAITGQSTEALKRQNQKLEDLLSICAKDEYSAEQLLSDSKSGISICFYDDTQLLEYLKKFDIYGVIKNEKAIMLFEDLKRVVPFEPYNDLLFTTEHVYILSSGHVHGHKREERAKIAYEDLSYDTNNLFLPFDDEHDYREKGVNYKCLFKLLEELKRKSKHYAIHSGHGDDLIDVVNVAKGILKQQDSHALLLSSNLST